MKKSFHLFLDSLEIVNELTEEQAGRLFKQIIQYNKDKTFDVKDQFERVIFLPFKYQFDRDFIAYIERSEKNKNNGKKGGRPKKPSRLSKNPKNPSGYLETQKTQTPHDTDTITDTTTITRTETITEKETSNTQLEIALIEFKNMRKKMKKQLTDHAEVLLLEKLEELSNGDEQVKIEILNNSTLNNWLGVFPLKQKPKQQEPIKSTKSLRQQLEEEQEERDRKLQAEYDAKLKAGAL